MEPKIDYTKVEPLPFQKTLVLVNDFIIKTTQFLNRFASLSEQKLSEVTRNIQRLEITLTILEAKLASIPDAPGTVPDAPSTITIAPGAPLDSSNGEIKLPPPSSSSSNMNDDMDDTVSVVDGGVQESGGLKYKEDPRYTKYFRLLKAGVAEGAVKQKMEMEGHNPDILDNPEGASDYVASTEEQEDEEHFSD